MKLRELTWPVRIYWDLPAGPPFDGLCLKICEEIVAIKILFLSLRETGTVISQSSFDVFDKLKDRNVGISLTGSVAALTPILLNRRSAAKVKTLLVETSTCDEVRSFVGTAKGYRTEGLTLGVSFTVGKGNYQEIPDVVSLCLNNGIRDLVFPIQRLMNTKECFFVDSAESEKLAERLKSINYHLLRITIHDPFLWKVFYPGADYHEGGCQAANSMLFISPEQKVYPCPAMPLILGDLRESTLKEIILSSAKKVLRGSLLTPPVECSACDQAEKCLGGCRGRALAATGSLDSRDPACAV